MHRAPRDWRAVLRRAKPLASRGDSAGLEVLFSGLRWRYDTARDRAIDALVSVGPSVIPRLLRTAEGADTAVERRAATTALGRLGNREVIPYVLRGLRDPNMSVRRESIVALLRLRAQGAVPPIARLLADPSGGVRVLAAGVLGKFRDRRAVPALIRAMSDEKWYVRQVAVRALGEIGDRRAEKAIETAMTDRRPAVKKAAEVALEGLRRQ